MVYDLWLAVKLICSFTCMTAPSPSYPEGQTSAEILRFAQNDKREGAQNDKREGARNDRREEARNDRREGAQNDKREGAQNDGREGAQNDKEEWDRDYTACGLCGRSVIAAVLAFDNLDLVWDSDFGI